jgi:hypothetical protein
VKATIVALEQLREKGAVADLRTIAVDKLDLFQPRAAQQPAQTTAPLPAVQA